MCDPVASACNLEEEAAERIDHESLCFLLWECVDSLLGKQHTKGLRAIRKFLCPLGQRCGALQTDMDSSTERVALRL